MMTTDTIRLRAVEPEDAQAMYDAENDSAAWKDSDNVAPFSMENIRNYAMTYTADPFPSGQLRLIVEEKESGAVAGIADLYEISALHRHAFAAIYTLPRFRNRGIAEATVKALCVYARDSLMLDSIGVRILASNHTSIRLFERCGFKMCGLMRRWRITPEGACDMILMQLMLRQD